jgi:2-aminoethylphosphonate-pyruvate transaminase
LEQFEKDGGLTGRAKRYNQNLNTLITEMTKIGFQSLLPKSVQAPIIVTFISPTDKKFKFNRFYSHLKKKGFIIYPGKMAKRDSFRIGCIGFIGKKEMKMLTNEIAKFVKMEKISLN